MMRNALCFTLLVILLVFINSNNEVEGGFEIELTSTILSITVT